MAHSAGAVEYTDCISVNRQDSTNECPAYDTKQFDGEFPAMLVFVECIAPRSTQAQSDKTWQNPISVSNRTRLKLH